MVCFSFHNSFTLREVSSATEPSIFSHPQTKHCPALQTYYIAATTWAGYLTHTISHHLKTTLIWTVELRGKSQPHDSINYDPNFRTGICAIPHTSKWVTCTCRDSRNLRICSRLSLEHCCSPRLTQVHLTTQYDDESPETVLILPSCIVYSEYDN